MPRVTELMPLTPAAEDLPASPFRYDNSRPVTPSKHSALRHSISRLSSRNPPNAAASESILHIASHGSPVAARRLPANVSPPILPSLGSTVQPVPSTCPTTAISADSTRDRPYSVMAESCFTDSLPGSIATSAAYEGADEVGPLPEARLAPRAIVNDGGVRAQEGRSTIVDATKSVPSISLHSPDTLGRSLCGSTVAPANSGAQFGDFDFISAATVSVTAKNQPRPLSAPKN